MLNHDVNVVNMSNEIKSRTKLEFRNCNLSYIFLNGIISVICEGKFTQVGTHVVEGHLEGTVSQIFYLGPRFNFMKSRELRWEKW